MKRTKTIGRMLVGVSLATTLLCAQQDVTVGPQQAVPPPAPTSDIRPTYVMGPGDMVSIRISQIEEIGERPYRIDSEGEISLPAMGKVHPGGLTVDQFEASLTEEAQKTVRNPQVTVTITQFRTDPIFLVGNFKTPGIFSLQGRRTLLEILTASGGLAPNASRRIKVQRRLEQGPIPLPNAVVDQEKKTSTVEISIDSLRENLNPAENIILMPLDTLVAERAEMVYVNGEVGKVGGIELGERDSISITQLITLAGGTTKDAAPSQARILRPVLNTSRRAEIPVDLARILSGKDTDFPLLPNDVLYVPRTNRSKALSSVGLIAVPMATGLIYVLVNRL